MTSRLFLLAAALAVASPAFPAAASQPAPEAVVAPVAAVAPVAPVADAPHVAPAQPAPAPAPAPAPTPAPPRAPRAPRPAAEAPQVAGTPAPPAAVAPEAPRSRRGQPVNVRVEFTVTDTTGSKAPVTKLLALTVADGETAMVRSESEAHSAAGGTRSAPFSADAGATVEGDRIRLFFSLDYQAMETVSGAPLKSGVRARQTVLLESGRPMVLSESSDPLSDRQVRVEVKATVLR